MAEQPYAIELAARITASERQYRDLADQCWRNGNVLDGLKYRSIAEGLELARTHQLAIAQEERASKQPEVQP